MESTEIILTIIIGFSIRKILQSGTLLDVKWMTFVILLAAVFVIIENLPLSKIINKNKNKNKKDKKKNEYVNKWVKLIATNASIVGVQNLVYA